MLVVCNTLCGEYYWDLLNDYLDKGDWMAASNISAEQAINWFKARVFV